MKHRSNFLAATLSIAISATSASASTYWFDGGTIDIAANGNGLASATGNGSWNATVKNWDQGNALAHIAWPNSSADTAVFGGSNTRTVTVSGTVTAGTMQMVNSGWIFTGGTIDTDNFDANGFTNTTLTSNLTGTINFKATGWAGDLGSTTSVIVNADNAGLISTTVNLNADANHIVLNNTGAFGADGADVQITKGVVNLGNTAATAISYNKWDIDLNGGTIRARFGIQTINGPVTVSANSWLMTRNANDAGQDPKLVFSSTATIDLGANTLSLHSAPQTDAGIELNGVISGTGNLTQAASSLVNAGAAAGLITLGAANTFSGTATLTANQGAFALNNVDALQNATLNTGASGTQAVTFAVSGANTYNFGALQGADALDIGGNSISVGSKAGTTTFSGAIGVASASGGLTKVGSSSTLQLTGTSIYSGGTQINAGTLSLGHATDTLANGGAVNVNGGELALGGNNDTVGAVTLTSGSITGSGGRLTGSSYDVRSGVISAKLGGSGVSLTKTTGGTVTITSDNSTGGYTGTTNVSAGKLVIDGNISTSSLTTVSGTGTLGGSGTVGALSVLNGGTLAPGNSPGTLIVGGTLSLENLSILSFELNPTDTSVGGGVNDLVTGITDLTLDGLLNVTASSGSFTGVTSGIWRLFNYTGTLTNNSPSFNTMPLLDSGYFWALDTATSNQVNLTIIPEPSAAILGGMGLVALLRRRRA